MPPTLAPANAATVAPNAGRWSRRRELASWALCGAAIVAGAAVLTLASPRFGFDVDVADMPILPAVAALAAAGLAYAVGIVALVKRSIGRGGQSSLALMALVIAAGLAARLILFGSEPILEDDYYRYLWDGAVSASGRDPYAISPADALLGANGDGLKVLAREAGANLERVNHPELRTLYPPVAQAVFALAHVVGPWSLTTWRALLLGFDIATLALIVTLLTAAGRSPLWSALYWWNPIVLKEVYNSAHFDVVALPFALGALLLSTRGRPVLAATSLALAAGVKVWPALLLPLVLRPVLGDARRQTVAMLVFASLAALFAAPVLLAGLDETSGLRAYVSLWQTNSALFPALRNLASQALAAAGVPGLDTGLAVRALIAGVLAAIAIGQSLKPAADTDDLMGRASLIVAALLIVSPAQFPWYYLWVAAFIPFRPWFGMRLMAATLPLYYAGHYLIAHDQAALVRDVVVWIIWVPVWLSLLVEWMRPQRVWLLQPERPRNA